MNERAAIACRRLRYAFGDTVAVDGITLTVAPGEIVGLLGPNGAGKTTVLRTVTTLLPVAPGTVTVLGYDVARDPMRVRRLLGYVPQLLSADANLTAGENVTLFARLYDVPRRRRRAAVAAALDTVGLREDADRLVGTFSGGMVRRLELAQALVSAPRVLVLDEPTIGLDPVARTAVWERITTVRREDGTAVLVTTHSMAEAAQSCDRVALMHRGTIRAQGPPQQLVDQAGVADLEAVFRRYTGDAPADTAEETGGIRSVRAARRTASRLQ